ncbi:hypothetical protein CEXT_288981 [Caerostris extrusa]|uniref:Uncharacterized protein n=1 Tax=Caerostris extrusa TaxID=172846 RepID=A0AAV4XVX8_CAEEX|nr:hypothetical protein CEXT_288981 [Caerostris extrusa]
MATRGIVTKCSENVHNKCFFFAFECNLKTALEINAESRFCLELLREDNKRISLFLCCVFEREAKYIPYKRRPNIQEEAYAPLIRQLAVKRLTLSVMGDDHFHP